MRNAQLKKTLKLLLDLFPWSEAETYIIFKATSPAKISPSRPRYNDYSPSASSGSIRKAFSELPIPLRPIHAPKDVVSRT